MSSPQRITLIFIALALAVLGFLYFPRQHCPASKDPTAGPGCSRRKNKKSALNKRTKFVNCKVLGKLPDHACTPGGCFFRSGAEHNLRSGVHENRAQCFRKLKKKRYSAYSVPYPQATGSYELDHLIPLALGGNNEPANLFPEAARAIPRFSGKRTWWKFISSRKSAPAERLSQRRRNKLPTTGWNAQ